MRLLSIDRLSVSLRGRDVFRDISFSIGAGELVGLIGPNGSGKTTLMRAALGLIPFDGHSSLAALPENARARHAAWMPQAREIAWPVTVESVVRLGRLPHLTAMQSLGRQDHDRVDDALAQMKLTGMRHRAATRLSGGEQARVLIARALVQDTPLLLADEPVAGLDPAHQIATMDIFAEQAAAGKSLLVSLHDLGLAARHCTRLILLGEGRLVADGPPRDVLTPQRLAQIFGISAWYQQTEQGPVYQPLEVIR
ncbi:ABC transporter ATP-binding protein [Rhodobacteraceae bacterium F11138]|nr:ABC transporter ATP-binding protein [Rhodobacteraceae bacterium F11138]